MPDNVQRAAELIARLREVADEHSATPAQIALAWVIHHPAVAAIPGASSVGQVEENAAAADIELTEEEYQAPQVASNRFRLSPNRSRFPAVICRGLKAGLERWRTGPGPWRTTENWRLFLAATPGTSGDSRTLVVSRPPAARSYACNAESPLHGRPN